MGFKEYQSIEDIMLKKAIIKDIKNVVTNNDLFIVTEKIDGANLSFIVFDNREDIEIAKRSGVVPKNDRFYDAKQMLNIYEKWLRCIYQKIKQIYGKLEQIQIYGEHFGWYYDWKKEKWNCRINHRVSYIPFTDYIVFDIGYIEKGDVNMKYIEWDVLKKIVSECWLKHVPEIYRWTLEEVLKVSNKFKTLIPQIYWLEEINNNIAEGIVIKTLKDLRMWKNNRIIIKSKNDEFKEKWKIKKIHKEMNLTELQKKYLYELSKFIEENRIISVISKWLINIDELKNKSTKEIGKLKWLLIKDALEDLIKENSEYERLDKKDKKIIQKNIQLIVDKIINEWINSL